MRRQVRPTKVRHRRSSVDRALKRLIDVVIASVALLLLSPVLLVVTLLLLRSGPGNVLYSQTRVGIHQRPFLMYKFRTMHAGCDEAVHLEYVRRLLTEHVEPKDGLYKLQADPRVTRLGSLLRRSSIDELPQLVNVLRGDMSLVGPRPALPYEVELFPPWAAPRFTVRPGITGLWQVSGRNRLSMLEGLRLDLQYVAHHSIGGDLVILVRTIPAVLAGGAR